MTVNDWQVHAARLVLQKLRTAGLYNGNIGRDSFKVAEWWEKGRETYEPKAVAEKAGPRGRKAKP